MTNAAPAATESIVNTPGAEIDARTAFAQIGMWTLARVGAKNRAFAETYIQFDATCGRKKRRFIVKLDVTDTYSVEVGQVVKFDYRVLRQVTGVYCDQLSGLVEELYQEVMA